MLKRDGCSDTLQSASACRLNFHYCNAFAGGRDILLGLTVYSWFRKIVNAAEKQILPGIYCHFLNRKKRLRIKAEGIISGFGKRPAQLVVLGAGADSTAAGILAGFPDVTAYELDHPLTQKFKKTALLNCLKEGFFTEAGNEKRFHLISSDLGNESPSVVLEAAGFQKEIPAVILAEGLFMYIPQERLKKILQDLRAVSAEGSALIFTWLQNSADGKPDYCAKSLIVRTWLALHREKFVWGTETQALREFLRECGWEETATEDPSDFLTAEDQESLPFCRGGHSVGEYITAARTL